MSSCIKPKVPFAPGIPEREKTSFPKSSHNGRDYCNLTDVVETQVLTDYSQTRKGKAEQPKILCEAKKATALSEEHIIAKKEDTVHSKPTSQSDSEFIYSEPNLTNDFPVGFSDTDTSIAFSDESNSSEDLEFGDSPAKRAAISYDEPPVLTDRPHKSEDRAAISYDEPPVLTDRPLKSMGQLNAHTKQNTQEKTARSSQKKLDRAKTKIFSVLRKQHGSENIAATFVGTMLNRTSSQTNVVSKERKPLSTDYIAEAMDGHYFPNAPEVIKAKKEWLKAEGDEPFEKWLLTQPLICQQLPSVQYLSVEERKKFEVEIQNGQLIRNQCPYGTEKETTVFSGKGTAIFVLSDQQKLYANSHIAGEFHHSSFLSGTSVLAAGELKSNALGKILEISNKSGHYKPGATENITMLNFIKNRGVDLESAVYKEVLPSNIICKYKTAEIYLNSKGQALPSEMSDKDFHVTISCDDSGGIILHETRNDATAQHTKTLHRITLNTLKSKGADLEKVTFIRHNAPKITNCKEYLLEITNPQPCTIT